jgi:Mn-dependent DtxR family transcriptional regulator
MPAPAVHPALLMCGPDSSLIAWKQLLLTIVACEGVTPMTKITAANEDYLEAIYELGGDIGPVRSVDLALKLEVSKASVNNALSNLKKAGLVEQPYYGDITLTAEGKTYAASVLDRHHALYHFLLDILGVQPQVAVEEACRMEHAISDDTQQKLVEWLRRQ